MLLGAIVLLCLQYKIYLFNKVAEGNKKTRIFSSWIPLM